MKKYFTLFLFIIISVVPIHGFSQNIAGNNKITLVVHGGAGFMKRKNMTVEKETQYHSKLRESLLAGYKILEEGGSAEDAVIATIMIMENSPLFNAGKGAVFTSEGTNEMDASIMNGKDGKAGAVAGVKIIKNPILAAQAVKNKSVHVMMSGRGAEIFVQNQGIETVDPSYFYTEQRMKSLEKVKLEEKKAGEGSIKDKFGTVGAVALDKNGNICAATSTGGMTNKKYGRIGDSPIIGAGTYADNATCGVSATGHGEFFIRNVVAYDIAALMKYKNLSLAEATNEVVMKKMKAKGGNGGIVALDASGNISMTFNTPGMFRGYINQKGDPQTYIYKVE